jgi:hypothetical protein
MYKISRIQVSGRIPPWNTPSKARWHIYYSARQKKAEFKKLPTILEAANPLRRDFFEPLT